MAARKKAGIGPRAKIAAVPATSPAIDEGMLERRKGPPTLRLRGISPGLTVSDLRRSIGFYTDVLGFIVQEYWTDDDGALRGAMLKAGTCTLGLVQDDWQRGRDRRKGEGVRLWCETVQDVDALAVRIRAAGIPLAHEPKDDSWGARSLAVDDPDGYHFSISCRLPDDSGPQ
jgi:uncharacterized glyoxalase superfamily protein PhnB